MESSSVGFSLSFKDVSPEAVEVGATEAAVVSVTTSVVEVLRRGLFTLPASTADIDGELSSILFWFSRRSSSAAASNEAGEVGDMGLAAPAGEEEDIDSGGEGEVGMEAAVSVGGGRSSEDIQNRTYSFPLAYAIQQGE